jgi:hypothetical protein
MFALLEHLTGAADAPVHWDLLVEVSGQERLPTWRLEANPLEVSGPIAAVRVADHRPVYLDYEGEVSGGRGQVRRLDRGPATVHQLGVTEVCLELAGELLAGYFAIRPDDTGAWWFRPGAPRRG